MNFMVSQWMTEFVLVPLELVVLDESVFRPTGSSALRARQHRQPSSLNRLESIWTGPDPETARRCRHSRLN